MTSRQGPTSSRRRLRMRLRRLREEKGYSLDDVRKAMEWSLSKVIRIESGGVSISASDLKTLLAFYMVDDARLSAELLDLARVSRQRHWSNAYRSYAPQAYLDFLGYEDDAQCIKTFHPVIIPGLAQTESYARALIAALGRHSSTDAVDARLRLRMARQRHVFDRADMAHLQVVLDEPVLRRAIGGADVMRDQIDHLLRLAEDSKVDLVVIPESVGAHEGLVGAFSLLAFESDEDPDVVYLENAPGDVGLIDDVNDIVVYQQAFKNMVDQGRGGSDAADILATHQDLYRNPANS